MVNKNGGNAFVLEDAIPQLGDAGRLSLSGVYNVACITSYGRDEPVVPIIDAVRQLKDCTVYMTGNARKLPSAIRGQLPPNLILTGFLSDEDYVALLRSVDLILDLTCRENCLVCGAYEAVAVEKPMVISNTKVLKEHFSKGAVYAGHDQDSIILAIEEGLSRQSELSLGVKALKEELILKWEYKRRLLLDKLTLLCKLEGGLCRRSG
jgi:glycosyltransferase involved in cell wall biosynthesis